jgi:hypothetical protein
MNVLVLTQTIVLVNRVFSCLRKPVPLFTSIEPLRARSRDILPDVFCEDLVDQCLVSDPPALRLLTEAVQNVRIDTDCNQAARSPSKRRAADSTHRPQLLVRCLWNIREVNPSSRADTLSFPSYSRALR